MTPSEPNRHSSEINSESVEHVDVVVVGAGLAGLTASVTAARAGASVALVEARQDRGGRARSKLTDGFAINHGAHALYLAGLGTAVLKDLGIEARGRLPRQSGLAWWVDGARVPVRRLSAVGGFDGLRTMRRLLLPRAGRRAADGRPMTEWMDENVPDPARNLAEMLVRTSCYVADLSALDAGAALDQLARGARGVRYLHGGWQSLVSGLEQVARSAGVIFVADKVRAVRPGQGIGGRAVVELRSSRSITAASVVLAAGGPGHADSLLGGASAQVAGWAADADPVVAACLDVAVTGSRRRRPTATYGLGVPVYAVDHAKTAHVAPAGGAMWHTMFYEPDRSPEVDHRAVLEAMLEAVDPGWRDRAATLVFRKRSVVTHDRVRPVEARPSVPVGDLEGVFVAGDWLTGHGMLADAPITSGAEAGRAAARWAGGPTRSGSTATRVGAEPGPSSR